MPSWVFQFAVILVLLVIGDALYKIGNAIKELTAHFIEKQHEERKGDYR